MATTPNSQSAMDSAIADKKRNKLGYHRTSVACGQSPISTGFLVYSAHCRTYTRQEVSVMRAISKERLLLIYFIPVHCRRRKIRCLVAADDPQGRCENCIRLRKDCQFFPVDQQPPMEKKSRPSSRLETASAGGSVTTPISPSPTNLNSESVDTFYQYPQVSLNSPGQDMSTFPPNTFAGNPMPGFVPGRLMDQRCAPMLGSIANKEIAYRPVYGTRRVLWTSNGIRSLERVYDDIRPSNVGHYERKQKSDDEPVAQCVAIGTAHLTHVRNIPDDGPGASHGSGRNIRHAARWNRLASPTTTTTRTTKSNELPRSRHGFFLSESIPTAYAPRPQAEDDHTRTNRLAKLLRAPRNADIFWLLPNTSRDGIHAVARHEHHVWNGGYAVPYVRGCPATTFHQPSSNGASRWTRTIGSITIPFHLRAIQHFISSQPRMSHVIPHISWFLDGLFHF